jgi:hypothetical protein
VVPTKYLDQKLNNADFVLLRYLLREEDEIVCKCKIAPEKYTKDVCLYRWVKLI